MSTTRTPSGLKSRGRRLWAEITDVLELDEHERALLLEAARTADLLDMLAAIVAREGPILDGRPNPALVEARQQKLVLARLLASMRLPDDLTGQADLSRPQRRGGSRRPYNIERGYPRAV